MVIVFLLLLFCTNCRERLQSLVCSHFLLSCVLCRRDEYRFLRFQEHWDLVYVRSIDNSLVICVEYNLMAEPFNKRINLVCKLPFKSSNSVLKQMHH